MAPKKSKGVSLVIDEEAGTVTVTLPLESGQLSASGKNRILASTHGNQTTETRVNGQPVKIGLNAYYSANAF